MVQRILPPPLSLLFNFFKTLLFHVVSCSTLKLLIFLRDFNSKEGRQTHIKKLLGSPRPPWLTKESGHIPEKVEFILWCPPLKNKAIFSLPLLHVCFRRVFEWLLLDFPQQMDNQISPIDVVCYQNSAYTFVIKFKQKLYLNPQRTGVFYKRKGRERGHAWGNDAPPHLSQLIVLWRGWFQYHFLI